MAVLWDDILGWADGPSDYGPRFAHEGICFHTTEGSDRNDLAALLVTFKWQSRYSSGSYNMGVAMNEGGDAGLSGDATVVTAVDMDHASGGLSTRRDYVWAPQRYPWLAGALSDRTYNDPNGGLLNVVIRGSVKWWMTKDASGRTRYQRAPALIDALARIVIEFENRYGVDAVLCEHFHWQTNRADADAATGHLVGLVLERYHQIKRTPVARPGDAKFPMTMLQSATHQIPKLVVVRKGATLRRAPEAAAPKHWDATTEFTAELLFGINGWWAGRRRGAGAIFFFRSDDIVRSLGNMVYPDAADDTEARLAALTVKLTEAENARDEMQAVADALRADDEADAAALREALSQRDEAKAAVAELEASISTMRNMIRQYVEAADRLRELAA